MQYPNGGISLDLDLYNFVWHPQNTLKHNFQPNEYL
jgi:hypothetical protein